MTPKTPTLKSPPPRKKKKAAPLIITYLRLYAPFIVTMLLSLCIVFLKVQFFPRLHPYQLIGIFLLPVTLVSLFTHWKAGIFATLVNGLFLAYFIYYSDAIVQPQTWILFLLFILQGILIAQIQRRRIHLSADMELYANTFTYLPEPLVVLNASEQIIYMNKEAEQLLDIKKSLALHKHFSDITGLPLGDKVQRHLYKTKSGDNKYISVATREIINNFTSQPGVLVVLQDVTEEEQLKESHMRVLKHAPVLLSSLDMSTAFKQAVLGTIPRMGDSVLLFAFDEDGVLRLVQVHHRDPEKQKSLDVFLDKSVPGEQYLFGVSNAIQTGTTNINSKVHNNHKHEAFSLFEKIKPAATMAVPLIARERPIGAMLFMRSTPGNKYTSMEAQEARNIADLMAITMDNVQLYRNMHDAVKLREEHLSIASHELKTPLTSLLLQLQSVLKSIYHDPLANLSIERLLTLLKNAQEQSNRLSRLIDSLLDVSRIAPGKLDLKVEKIDLVSIVKKITDGFDEQVSKTGSELQLNTNGSVIGYWDRVRIEQVISNLISNALKYGSGKPIRVILETDSGIARLTVEDQGIGIPPDKHTEIFKPFTRAVTGSEYNGLGLGLYVTHQIIKAHRGKIFVKSAPSKGTSFVVELPIHQKRASNT